MTTVEKLDSGDYIFVFADGTTCGTYDRDVFLAQEKLIRVVAINNRHKGIVDAFQTGNVIVQQETMPVDSSRLWEECKDWIRTYNENFEYRVVQKKKIELPIFRAEVDLEVFEASGYIGSLLDVDGKRYAVGALTYSGKIEDLHGIYPIKKETLSINTKGMTDSEGTKIFASLSEDGKGGDNMLNPHAPTVEYITKLENGKFSIHMMYGEAYPITSEQMKSVGLKVIGIQEWKSVI